MKKIILFILLCLIPFEVLTAKSKGKILEETWKEFRQLHPYGLQTVALKHVDDLRVLVISEPSPFVSEQQLHELFKRYGGEVKVKKQKLGYDGWLKDVVGYVKQDVDSAAFTHELSTLLYGTDYKTTYTDLDHPSRHIYFSPYRLNYSYELFKDVMMDVVLKADLNKDIVSVQDNGFVTWVLTEKDLCDIAALRAAARQYAVDTDLTFCAVSRNDTLMIIGRNRIVPTSIMPPLRSETIIQMLTNREHIMHQRFGNGTKKGDVFISPIEMSETTKDTELGHLLILTDLMLKSWTENNHVHDVDYNIPAPIDFPFSQGAAAEMGNDPIVYYWNTENDMTDDETDRIAQIVSQTGSLPVQFSKTGSNEMDTIACIYFSSLNQPDLARVAQYNAFNQFANKLFLPSLPDSTLASLESLVPSSQWMKTPTVTRSSMPWGEGGMQLKVVKALTKIRPRAIKMPKVEHFTQNFSHFRLNVPQVKFYVPRNSHYVPRISHYVPRISHYVPRINLNAFRFNPNAQPFVPTMTFRHNASVFFDHSIATPTFSSGSFNHFSYPNYAKLVTQIHSTICDNANRGLEQRLRWLGFDSPKGAGFKLENASVQTLSDLRKAMAEHANSPISKNITLTECTARESYVSDGKGNMGIIERDAKEKIDISDYNFDESKTESNVEQITAVLEKSQERLSPGCKEEVLEVTIQNAPKSLLRNLVESVNRAIKQLFGKPADKVNNKFQLKYQLLKDLQTPGLHFDIQDIHLEEKIQFGNIIMQQDYETIFEMAA